MSLHYNVPGRSDIERPTARRVSETSQVDADHHSPVTVDRLVVHDGRRTRKPSVTSPDNWLGYYSRHHSSQIGSAQPDSGVHDSWTTEDGEDDDALSTFRSDSSTPEPPLSARPKNLVNHPKILKDQLHRSMTTLGTRHDVKFLNRSWTFAGR